MPRGRSDYVDVGRARTFLDRHCTIEWWRLFAEEVGLERNHSCTGEEQGRVDRNEGCRWTHDMVPLFEE